MRLVAQIPHPSCRISILSWNGKFLLKFEMGQMEHTFKVAESDSGDLETFQSRITPDFINLVLSSFENLDAAFNQLIEE